MSKCPVGESCLGCQYAADCAHPALQAERLRGEVARLTRAEADAEEARMLLTRERDEVLASLKTSRAEAEKLQQRLYEEIDEHRQASMAQYESRAESAVLAMLDANEFMDVGSLKLWCSDAEAAVVRLLKAGAIAQRKDGCCELTYSARRLASARAALASERANAMEEAAGIAAEKITRLREEGETARREGDELWASHIKELIEFACEIEAAIRAAKERKS